MPQPRKRTAPTIEVKGREYDLEKDFTWKELMLAEELSGTPLGRADALDSMAVGAAFIFVILKRTDTELTWEAFVDSPVAASQNANGNGASRPTKAAKKSASPRSA